MIYSRKLELITAGSSGAVGGYALSVDILCNRLVFANNYTFCDIGQVAL